jgi:hypothetical protein
MRKLDFAIEFFHGPIKKSGQKKWANIGVFIKTPQT